MRLYLTRHGETEWNREQRMQGRKDSPLTAEGLAAAEKLGQRLRDITFAAVYSSPASRAMKTCETIIGARAIAIQPEPSLWEMSFGLWEGQTAEDIKREYPDEHRHFWQEPDLFTPTNQGESFQEVEERVLATLYRLADEHAGEDVLLVAHAVVINLIMARLQKRPLSTLWKGNYLHGASLTLIEFQGREAQILLSGDTSHM